MEILILRRGADMRHEDYNLNTLLNCAASYGDVYVLDYLIEHNGALINTRNADGHIQSRASLFKMQER